MGKRIEPYQWVVNLRFLVQSYLGDYAAKVSPRILNKLAKLLNNWTKPISQETAEKLHPADIKEAGFIPKDYEEGKVKHLSLTGGRLSTFHHVLDYIKTCYADGIDPEKLIVGSGSFLSIINGVNSFFHSRTKNAKVDGKTKTLKTIDGYKFVQLLDEQAYRFEGNKMDNCVGDYWNHHQQYNDKIRQNIMGECRIISVRKGAEHLATIEIRGNVVIQIEGPHNSIHLPQYIAEAIIKFFDLTIDEHHRPVSKKWSLTTRANMALINAIPIKIKPIKITRRHDA